MTSSVLQAKLSESARIVGQVQIPENRAQNEQLLSGQAREDFIIDMAANPWSGDLLRQELSRILAEIGELESENRWEDIVSLFHPVQDKLPELTDSGMVDGVRLKIAFALGRAGRHDDAVHCLEPVVKNDPENHLAHYNLAYTLLDQLFTARTNRQAIPPKEKSRAIEKAHKHFRLACELKPESVTFFYREGVLFKEIENKPRKAIPLFEKAIANWEQLDDETRKNSHQQRPKYIKSMYHLASCLLQCGRPERSRSMMEKLLRADRDRNYMHPLFKHFAMGKIMHALGRPKEALEHLEVAAYRADRGQATDFVHELAARCALLLGQPERAAKYIDRVPVSRRRPYVRWTEADVLVARGRKKEALKVLDSAAERDRRGRHKALLRMARIHLSGGNAKKALELSIQAAEFCAHTYGSESHEAMFWQAAALYRLERFPEAQKMISALEQRGFQYPHFRRLAGLVRHQAGKQSSSGKSPNGHRPGGNRGFSLVSKFPKD
ncbi:tetratricopeptide repeat protein [Desulfolithobacter sp.]